MTRPTNALNASKTAKVTLWLANNPDLLDGLQNKNTVAARASEATGCDVSVRNICTIVEASGLPIRWRRYARSKSTSNNRCHSRLYLLCKGLRILSNAQRNEQMHRLATIFCRNKGPEDTVAMLDEWEAELRK